MIKPNLIVSHDWHVQPYCQRSLWLSALAAPLGSRLQTVTSELSSNLLRSAQITLSSGHGHFCANLLNLSNFRYRVKPRFCWNQDSNSLPAAGRFSRLFDRHCGSNYSSRRRSHCAKFQRSTDIKVWRILRAQEDSPPGSCNGFVLCGIPYRGQGCGFRYLNPTLRTGFPLPTWGRPHRPPGGSTATSATF